jgi:diguanylate cyclase (GGDEF)-like protein
VVEDPARERSFSDRFVGWVTLASLPAWAAVLVIAALVAVSWLSAYYLGGGTNVAPHWFYLPIFMAGLRFGPVGALVAGGVSMYVAGPLLPADSATGAPQALSDWVSRGVFFILIGQFVTALFGGVRRSAAREARLATEVELVHHQAFHDPLTGLANRYLFAEHLERAVERRGRIGAGVAVLFIDLDGFKDVNDLYGHALGDQLLKRVADRLTTNLRDADIVARLCGDEFAVLFEVVALDSKPQAATTRLIEAFTQPFRLGSSEIFVTPSIGIARDDTGTETGEELLRNADHAMYAAKTRNGAGYEVFSAGMHSTISHREQLVSGLRRALDHGEFQVYYQPIIEAAAAIEGVEALIRWNHPERGLVLPGEFIGAAESSGIIIPIGEWMLRHACQEFETTTRSVVGGENLGLSVNISPRQLSDPTLCATVERALLDAGLTPERLTLEITEHSIMEDVPNTIRVFTQLRETGVKIAIDDFGTGFSSLSLLTEIPVDELKIDRAFITDIARRPEPARLIQAILLLAADLGLRAVAEGVEELEQHKLLQELGCQASQGFYFARPQPAAQLLELLRLEPTRAVSTE